MKRNVGVIDRIIRIIFAIVIAVLYFAKQLSGTALIVLAIIAGIMLFTGITGFCALYVPFGISTIKKKAE